MQLNIFKPRSNIINSILFGTNNLSTIEFCLQFLNRRGYINQSSKEDNLFNVLLCIISDISTPTPPNFLLSKMKT